jgi:hypothetical protein
VAASTNFILGEVAWENKRECYPLRPGALANNNLGVGKYARKRKGRKIRHV